MFLKTGDFVNINILRTASELGLPTENEYKNKPGLTQAANLIKTADQKIVALWEPDKYLYFRCRGITAGVSNQNGDFFPLDEIRSSYKTFIGKGFYKDHDTDSVDKMKGKILSAKLIELENDKYVENLIAVDRIKDPELVRQIDDNIVKSVSMGCLVNSATCSVCNNTATNPENLCEHMNSESPKYCKGARNKNGEIIYEINHGITFIELSAVSIPADPTAHIFETIASHSCGSSKNLEQALNQTLDIIIGYFERKIKK